MVQVTRGSLWEYVGVDVKYRGSKHCVLSLHINDEGSAHEVVTWCKIPGISWLGELAPFLKEFKPTTGTFSFI